MRIIKVFAIGVLTIAAVCFQSSLFAEALNSTNRPSVDLKLSELVQRVLQRNETLQVKLLDFEVARRKYLAEKGIFEPAAYANISRQVDNRQNSSVQAGALLGSPFYHATNTMYDGGLEESSPLGTKFHLGYTITQIHDTLQPASGFTNGEFQSFIGFNVTQPLLKNAGTGVGLAALRIAALSSKIAFQEYRQQLMQTISTAEATYWNLYLAQEQEAFFEESVKTAGLVVRDNRTRVEAGTASQLDVMEAQSGLSLRQAKLNEARQKRIEAANQVIALYAELPNPYNVPVRAVDAPHVRITEPHYEDLQRNALDWNPDYLIQQEKVRQNAIRLGYARNQRLPQLDAKGGYGINGIGDSPNAAWTNGLRNNFVSWSAGLEFRMPLGGDIKAKNEFSAAQLQMRSSETAAEALRNQIATGMDSAWHKLEGARNSTENYHTTVMYNQSLLDSALAGSVAGKLEGGKVLDVESSLLEAKDSEAESLVRYEVALLELEVIEGALLQNRHIEVTQDTLQAATRRFVGSSRLTDEKYRQGLAATYQLYQSTEKSPGDPVALRHAAEAERQKIEELNASSTNTPIHTPEKP